MADKLMYMQCNDDKQKYPFCRLQLVVETFKHNLMNQPTKGQYSPQSC